MSATRTSSVRSTSDHFEPDDIDPQEQRRRRGQLEQIDYTTFAANKEVVNHTLGYADAAKFQHLAIATATARAQWVAEALKLSTQPHSLSPAEVARLTHLRTAHDELAEAYEGLRRMVERGYLTYRMPEHK